LRVRINDCLFVQNVCPNYTRKAPVKEIDGPGNRESLMNSKYGISCSITPKSAYEDVRHEEKEVCYDCTKHWG